VSRQLQICFYKFLTICVSFLHAHVTCKIYLTIKYLLMIESHTHKDTWCR
jgi:hypothetical protein